MDQDLRNRVLEICEYQTSVSKINRRSRDDFSFDSVLGNNSEARHCSSECSALITYLRFWIENKEPGKAFSIFSVSAEEAVEEVEVNFSLAGAARRF